MGLLLYSPWFLLELKFVRDFGTELVPCLSLFLLVPEDKSSAPPLGFRSPEIDGFLEFCCEEALETFISPRDLVLTQNEDRPLVKSASSLKLFEFCSGTPACELFL